ncbi:DUF1176 domain-containing protein [Stenotrophomonas sp. TEPEL]|uniref:DUF1176 domain-containing protein n=1 Tax=Stenotrophomonas sp. TEPEL TaxID=2283801 RepID=UPI001404D295|nr:DUF1176 domain-containing protein [Stenotrophomonas sp. TEPEL]
MLASLTLAPVSFAGTPAQFTFPEQNGHLACDNTGTCRMVAFGPPAALMLGVLLERAAGPDTPVMARLSLADGSDGAPRSPRVHPEGRLRLHVDGADLGDIGPADALEAGLALAPPHAQALLDALGRGRPVRMTDTAGQAWPLAESGNAALLLKMDEVQGRLHTPGALVDKGLRPESQVPVARVAPRLVPPPLHAVFLEEGVASATDRCGTDRHWAWDGTRLVLAATFVGRHCLGAGQRHWQLPTYVTELR